MIKRIRIIGIGMGDPDQVTGKAAPRLGTVDVIPVADEGEVGADLAAVRQRVCDALIPSDRPYRLVEMARPATRVRMPNATRRHTDRGCAAGTRSRSTRGRRSSRGCLPRRRRSASSCGATPPSMTRPSGWSTPSWRGGRPAVWRSTTTSSRASVRRSCWRRVTESRLGRMGAPVHITTGRRLVDEFDPGLGDVVVMLDGHLACAALVDGYPDLELCWGAYLGSADELLVRGRLADVIEEVEAGAGRGPGTARLDHGHLSLATAAPTQPTPSRVGPTLHPFSFV